MKKYISTEMVSTDLHAGGFFWHKYQEVLEFFEDGSAKYYSHITDKGVDLDEPSPFNFIGKYEFDSSHGWSKCEFQNTLTEKLISIHAKENGDELYCNVYSEFNESTSCLLFKKIE